MRNRAHDPRNIRPPGAQYEMPFAFFSALDPEEKRILLRGVLAVALAFGTMPAVLLLWFFTR